VRDVLGDCAYRVAEEQGFQVHQLLGRAAGVTGQAALEPTWLPIGV
jgi:hypothetical protein